jgi:hypothetical protein
MATTSQIYTATRTHNKKDKSADSIDDAKRLWEVSERLVGLVVQEK